MFSFNTGSLSAEDNNQDLQTVEVKKGDTLSKIAKQYLEDPSKWRELLKYNKISNPNVIKPGLVLRIPRFLGKSPVATIVFKAGPSTFKRNNESKWSDTFLKLGLYFQDALRTTSKSTVQLEIVQRGIVKVMPDSYVVINKKGKAQQDEISLLLKKGSVSANINRQKEMRAFSLVTPSAMAAVRGTTFYASVDEAQTSRVGCTEGLVDVSAQKVTVNLKPGYATYVEKGKAPVKPFLLPLPPEIEMPE